MESIHGVKGLPYLLVQLAGWGPCTTVVEYFLWPLPVYFLFVHLYIYLAKAPSFSLYLAMYSCVPIGFPFATSVGLPSPLPVPIRQLAAWISRSDARQFPRPMRSFEIFAPSPAAMCPSVSPLPPNFHPGSSSWRGFPPPFSLFPGDISLTYLKAMESSFPTGVFLGVYPLPFVAISSPFRACLASRDCWSPFLLWTILVPCGLFSLNASFISSDFAAAFLLSFPLH